MLPKHGSTDGSMFASRSKGHGFESRWILQDRASKNDLFDTILVAEDHEPSIGIVCEPINAEYDGYHR